MKHLIKQQLIGDLFPRQSLGASDGLETPTNEDGLKWCFGSTGFTNPGTQTVSVDENNAVGAAVFDANARISGPHLSLQPLDKNITYSLQNHDASLFEINVGNGIVTARQQLDYENATSHSFTVEAQWDTWSPATQVVIVNVNDLPDSGVSFTSGTSATIEENSNAAIYTAIASGSGLSYSCLLYTSPSPRD